MLGDVVQLCHLRVLRLRRQLSLRGVGFFWTRLTDTLLCCMLCAQDGTIQLEMKLTGILSTSLMTQGDRSTEHGIVVAPGMGQGLLTHYIHMESDYL
jgi:hypothetical protein